MGGAGMRKFLVFLDGGRYELTPLTLEEFTHLDRWVGGNDTAFNHFLRANGFHELDSFDEEQVNHMVFLDGRWQHTVIIELVLGEPVIDWTIKYGS